MEMTYAILIARALNDKGALIYGDGSRWPCYSQKELGEAIEAFQRSAKLHNAVRVTFDIALGDCPECGGCGLVMDNEGGEAQCPNGCPEA